MCWKGARQGGSVFDDSELVRPKKESRGHPATFAPTLQRAAHGRRLGWPDSDTGPSHADLTISCLERGAGLAPDSLHPFLWSTGCNLVTRLTASRNLLSQHEILSFFWLHFSSIPGRFPPQGKATLPESQPRYLGSPRTGSIPPL